MTTPTQAADIIKRLKESIHTFNRNSTHTLPAMEGFIRRHLRELDGAIAALTAAAEVGKQYTAIVLCDRELENKTIERCAQVAEDYYKKCQAMPSSVIHNVCLGAANEIRALKDKP